MERDSFCTIDNSLKSETQTNALFAIPKKGRLYDMCVKLLSGAGLDYHRWAKIDFQLGFFYRINLCSCLDHRG